MKKISSSAPVFHKKVFPIIWFGGLAAFLIMKNTNPPRITLRLLKPGKLGAEITFTPQTRFSLNPFAKKPIVEDLIVRVDRARRVRD